MAEGTASQAQDGSSRLATALAVAAGVVVILLIYAGSSGMKHFDAALIGYAVGTLFAIVGLVYRYTLWLTRPPTGRYFRAGWSTFLSWRNFRRYTLLVPKALWTDIFAQTFILKRSPQRWVMHMAIFWGVLLSLLITIPLTFGWIHFTLVPPDDYKLWVFGLPIMTFPLETVVSFMSFHALNFTAILLLIGVGIAFWRRTRDAGHLSVQRFAFDMWPLVLLFAIAVTGLLLTASVMLWEGSFFWFTSLVHQAVVVVWLLSLPFGKFFHIVERPATVGITLYNQVNEDHEREGLADPAPCRGCGELLPSGQFITDLKATLGDLGQDYSLGEEHGYLQDYCPSCKRKLRGQAYYQLMGRRFI